MTINLEQAASELAGMFDEVQRATLQGEVPPIQQSLIPAFDAIFKTSNQSPREALLGIVLVRLQAGDADLTLPYVNQGASAYNGRDLDERVVNPFLQQHRIPCSKGPYLAMFRRDFRFDKSRRDGVRDKVAFDSLLKLIDSLAGMTRKTDLRDFLRYLLYRFAKLREASEVALVRLQRMSLRQYESLIESLLNTPSGGRFPVMIVVAALHALKDYFDLNWSVEYQGINVADSATGAGGDITVLLEGQAVFSAEVTERPLERARVVATFNSKIAPQSIPDYLFFVRSETLDEGARHQANQYFAQGHEVNFLEVRGWAIMLLATMGTRGRKLFHDHLIALLDDTKVPKSLKVAWNEHVSALAS